MLAAFLVAASMFVPLERPSRPIKRYLVFSIVSSRAIILFFHRVRFFLLLFVCG